MLPAMPSACAICGPGMPSAAATPAAAPIVPMTAVGWKPARWIAVGATTVMRHISSIATAMPASASPPLRPNRSQAARTPGIAGAPA